MAHQTVSPSHRSVHSAPARFGRVRVLYEESPLSLAIAGSLALTGCALLWIMVSRPDFPPVRLPELSLQPITYQVSGLQDGSAGPEDAPELLQDAQFDQVAREESEPVVMPKDQLQSPAHLARDLASGNVAELTRDASLALKEADELLLRMRASPRRLPTKDSSTRARAALRRHTSKSTSGQLRKRSKGRLSATSTSSSDGPSARFFGLGADGANSVVYVIDCSGSMRHRNKVILAKRELMRSIRALRPEQGFFIVFFRQGAILMPAPGLVLATDQNKQLAWNWTQTVSATGSTNPVPAIRRALMLGPEVIYVLSDGKFSDGYCTQVRQLNRAPRPARIYAIGFGSRSGERQLKRLARENGGQYRYVRP